jgi:hypothetical protein
MNMKSSILAVVAMSLAFTSCIKKEVTPLADEGKTFVKILETPENAIFMTPFTTIKSVPLFSVRKDAPTNAALQKSTTVTLTRIDALITRYNSAHGTAFEVLPDSLYTLDASISRSGNTYTFNFGSGDFAKDLSINLNGAKWDLAHKYALGFALSTPGAGNYISSGLDTIVAMISLKNQWDGVYSVVSGTVTRYTAPGVPAGDALSGSLAGNPDIYLMTTGATRCNIPPASSTGGLFWAYGNNSMVAGIDGLRADIDPGTNLVTMSSTGNATLTNWAGKVNSYNPATKTFTLGFRWNPTANVREYEVVMKYKKAR